jgi:hypothetical protein
MSEPNHAITVQTGYLPGVIGRVAEMHGLYYSRTAGFGQFFEARVASGIAEEWTGTQWGSEVAEQRFVRPRP